MWLTITDVENLHVSMKTAHWLTDMPTDFSDIKLIYEPLNYKLLSYFLKKICVNGNQIETVAIW